MSVDTQAFQPALAFDNHYKLLGLELDCSEAQIKQAYRRLAAKWHPDKWVSSTTPDQQQARLTFDKIKTAHDVLCDCEARARYDASLFSRSKS